MLLASPAAALAFLLVLAAAGARLRTLLRVPLAADLKAPADVLAGCWIYAMLSLLVGVLLSFSGPVLLGLAAALAAAGRWSGAGWRLRPLLPQALSCALFLPVALAPPFFYDALVYHLALPWQALVEGRIAAHREDLFSAFPPLAQMVFAPLIALGLDRAAAIAHLASFVLGASVVSAMARRLGATRAWAAGAGAILPLLPAVVPVPGFPAAEGFTVCGVLLALAIAVEAIAPRPGAARSVSIPRRRAALAAAVAAGLLAGIATSARLQGSTWAAILLVVLLLGPRPRVLRLLAAATGWIAGSAPWWGKNLVLLGDPLAPIGWRRPGIETLWRDSAGWMHAAAGPADLAVGLWSATRAHLPYVGFLLLAALVAVSAARGRRAVALLLSAALGTIAWCLTGSLPRFWTPALGVLLALAAAAGATSALGGAARWLSGLALGVAAIAGVLSTTQALAALGGPRLLLAPRDAAARALVVNDPLPAFSAAATLPTEIWPRDGKVLFVAEARGYRFPGLSLVPSQHDVSPLRDLIETSPDAVAVRARLAALGITHLLINRSEMARLARDYPVLPWSTPEGQARFQALVESCGAPIVKVGETALLALR